jgi:hypothetical protein
MKTRCPRQEGSISWLTGVSNLSLLECFALTPNAVGFLGVRMGPPSVAAVGSMQRLRMSAHANVVAVHVTLALSAMQSTPKGGVKWSGPSHFEIGGRKRISQHLSRLFAQLWAGGGCDIRCCVRKQTVDMFAIVLILVIAPNASKASSSAYSVRSCPLCSCQRSFSRFFILHLSGAKD